MLIAHYALLGLLIVHFIALIFWWPLFKALLNKELSSEKAKRLARAFHYSITPTALIVSFALLGSLLNLPKMARYALTSWFTLIPAVILTAFAVVLYRWPRVREIVKRALFSKILRNLCVGASCWVLIFYSLIVPTVITGLKVAKVAIDNEGRVKLYQASPERDGLVDVRGQIHAHCYLSHDSKGTLEEITQAAKKNGVRWIILTDHLRKLPPGNYPNYVNGVLIIYGCERNGPEGTSLFRASLKDSKEELFLHGHVEGFGSSGNPEWGRYRYGDEWIYYDAIELVNFHSNAFDNKLGILEAVFFQPGTLYDNITCLMPRNFDYWQRLAEKRGQPMPIFAAPDSHQNQKILGVQTDPYELTFGLISTHIWIKQGQELNQETIFEAIRAGRTYAAFDYLGDPTGFQFYAESGGKKYFTCETAEKPEYLTALLPDCLLVRNSSMNNRAEWDASTVDIKFYCNNRLTGEIKKYPEFLLDMPPHTWIPQPGFWRVELWRNGKPWIVSGQILIK